jgi:hypothetical protein
MRKIFLLAVLFGVSLTLMTKFSFGNVKSEMVAKQLGEAVVIDGEIDPIWSLLKFDEITNKLGDGALDDADFSGRIKVAWYENFIYVFVEVTDNVIVADPTWAHKQDACEFYVSLLPEDGIADYSAKSTFYKTINADGSASGGRSDAGWEPPTEGVEVAVGLTETGWFAEWSIDVSLFGLNELKVGQIVALDVSINDNDNPDEAVRTSQYTWSKNSTGNNWAESSGQNGMVTLGELVVSAKNFKANSLKIYPNPTANNFTINADASLVDVYSIIGKKVKSFANVSANESFNIEGLSGLYFVTVTDKKGLVASQKLVVK